MGYLRVKAVCITKIELSAMKTAATGGEITNDRPGSSSSSSPAAAGSPKKLKLQAQRRQTFAVLLNASANSRKETTPLRLQQHNKETLKTDKLYLFF